MTLLRGEEGEHQPYEGALSYARLSYYSCEASGAEVVTERVYDFPGSVRIGEINIVEAYSHLSFETYRLSPFLLREFEFAETVNRCDGMHCRRELSRKPRYRPLDLAYKLKEGRHSTEGYRSRSNAGNAPGKGRHVACREAELDYGSREEGVVVAGYGLLSEVVLIIVEGAYGLACVLERGDQGPVLDIFLKMGVDTAVSGADVVCELTHTAHVCPAEKKGHGHNQQHDKGEAPFHRPEEDEGRDELYGCGDDCRDCPGEGVGYLCHVSVKPAEHISCMEGFPADPTAFHYP